MIEILERLAEGDDLRVRNAAGTVVVGEYTYKLEETDTPRPIQNVLRLE